MQAVIFPKLYYLFSLFTLEVLNDGNAPSLGESEKLRGVLGVDASENERVVDGVNVAIEECGAHGVGSRADHEVAVHHIGLKAGCLEARHVLSN